MFLEPVKLVKGGFNGCRLHKALEDVVLEEVVLGIVLFLTLEHEARILQVHKALNIQMALLLSFTER